MTSEDWQEVKSILDASLDLPPVERQAFLARVCEGRPALLREVHSLLASSADIGSFLEPPPLGAADSLSGQQVGRYHVVEEIGRGGMGAVYRAVRTDDFEKQVAIKVVSSQLGGGFLLDRFLTERQILARLEHPNIARILDGGALADGRPYLIMEYVAGSCLTEYCDHRRLPVRQRVELFRQVCSAVQYAHQNLVVHRDLKPANILVTGEGVPKLLDFGIAKLLAPSGLPETAGVTAVRLLTPHYASPEQILGGPVSTATDVYSLGVVLYELLTGRLPYRRTGHSNQELERAICEEDPERPGAAVSHAPAPVSVCEARGTTLRKLRLQLSGELENILLKSIRKAPAERYASVEQFSEDVARYLDGRPVRARTDSPGYRARKFLRRHKFGALAAALVGITLVAGIAATAWQARIARAERAEAVQRFNDVRRLANTLVFEIHDAIENLPGATEARELLLKRALEFLDGLARRAAGDLSLQRELAAAYKRIGEVQGHAGSSNLGQTGAAVESYRKALRLRESIASRDPTSVSARRELAAAYDDYAHVCLLTGDAVQAESNYQTSLRMRETLAAERPDDPDRRGELASSFYSLGMILSDKGDWAASAEGYRKALALYEEVAAARPSSPARQKVALASKRLGAVLIKRERWSEALEHYRRALAIEEALAAASPRDPLVRMNLSFTLSDIGFIHRKQGDRASALPYYRRALAIREQLAAADPRDQRARAGLARTYENIGRILCEDGKPSSALPYHRRSLAIRETLVAGDDKLLELRLDLSRSYDALAMAFERLRQWQAARDWYQREMLVLTELKARGYSTQDLADQTGDAARAMARCDREIAKLGASR